MWPCFSRLFLGDAYLASNAALDWEIRVLDFAIEREIRKRISPSRNPSSGTDFAFDNKSEMRILNSKSRFPNRKHPACELSHFAIESSNTALTSRRLNRLKLLFTWYSWTPSYGHFSVTHWWPIRFYCGHLLTFLQATKIFTCSKL